MDLPPQLKADLDRLKSERGLNIESDKKEGEQICVIVKDYPLPKKIWNREKTNLLVLVPPVYPNAKLDMFWVYPKDLKFADGGVPQAAECIENHCGIEWQRFSRHPEKWNPARDNIITYFECIDHWLSQKVTK
jgi:hypothetical protein